MGKLIWMGLWLQPHVPTSSHKLISSPLRTPREELSFLLRDVFLTLDVPLVTLHLLCLAPSPTKLLHKLSFGLRRRLENTRLERFTYFLRFLMRSLLPLLRNNLNMLESQLKVHSSLKLTVIKN